MKVDILFCMQLCWELKVNFCVGIAAVDIIVQILNKLIPLLKVFSFQCRLVSSSSNTCVTMIASIYYTSISVECGMLSIIPKSLFFIFLVINIHTNKCMKMLGKVIPEIIGDTVCRYIGDTVCRYIGDTVCRYIGGTVCRYIGDTVCRYIGDTVCRYSFLFQCSKTVINAID